MDEELMKEKLLNSEKAEQLIYELFHEKKIPHDIGITALCTALGAAIALEGNFSQLNVCLKGVEATYFNFKKKLEKLKKNENTEQK